MIDYVLTELGLEVTDSVARNIMLDPDEPLPFELVEDDKFVDSSEFFYA